MATLKQQLPSSPQLVSEYRSKTVVFLEGETDVNLFRNYWFKHRLDKLDFTEPQDGIGCTGVVDSVRNYRLQGIPAFGLVDRDKLLADEKWNLLWETDDETFNQAQPYGAHVQVTRYWEIESYLIDPMVIEAHVSHCEKGRAPRPDAEALAECLAHAEALIPHTALNAAKQKNGDGACGDGQTSKFPTRVEVEREWQRLKDAGEISSDVWNDYEAAIPKVEAFSGTGDTAHRLRALLRVINGKAMLHRILHKYRLGSDHTFLLAEALRAKNAIPPELRDIVDTFAVAGEAA